jgi:hypothetical protein
MPRARGRPRFEPRASVPATKKGRKRIEMLFAHLKRILQLGRLRLREPSGARDEFLLVATAQNQKTLARLVPAGSLDPAPA